MSKERTEFIQNVIIITNVLKSVNEPVSMYIFISYITRNCNNNAAEISSTSLFNFKVLWQYLYRFIILNSRDFLVIVMEIDFRDS